MALVCGEGGSTTQEVFNEINGVTLGKVPMTGVQDTQDWLGDNYVDPDAIGANPTAKIYPDGSIVGSTDNGSYVKYANGRLECFRISANWDNINTADGAIYRSPIATSQYPFVFVAIPSGYGKADVSGVIVSVLPSLSSVDSTIHKGASSTNPRSGKITVVGRWK